MTGSIWIVFWWLAFGLTHSGMSHLPWRTALVGRLGDRGFAGVYSLVAIGTFVPLVLAYSGQRHSGPRLWQLSGVPGLHACVIGIDLLAFALLATALVAPSPVSMAGGAAKPGGMLRVTRHPLFVAIALWATGHLLVTGYLSDVFFFGGFVLYALVGAAHQDQRKRLEDGGRLADFFAETSLLPLAAVMSRRSSLRPSELPWLTIALGIAMGIGVYRLHPMLFW